MQRTVVVILASFLLACGGASTQPVAPTVTGAWTGVTVGPFPYRMTIDLLESRGTVTGSGLLDSWVLTASGTFVDPVTSVTITFTSGTTRTINFRGTLAGNTITGELNGDIFRGNALSLSRPSK